MERAFLLQDGLATDRRTHLTWIRCAIGMHWDTQRQQCIGRPTGLRQDQARKAATQAGPGWHVPTAYELSTLRVDSCVGPKIDAKVFPNVASSEFGEGANFWTSTEALPGTFYFVNFADGSVDFHSAGFFLSTILVRNAPGDR
nr:DUF1566 domain-containing protein [Caballeronia sp. ATUFL_M2_KS44]